MKPSPGRIVIYTDGKMDYAATVTNVYPFSAAADLYIFPHYLNEVERPGFCVRAAKFAGASETTSPGTWRWPERV